MYQKIDCAKHWMFAHGFHVILHQLSTKRPHPSKSNPWVDQCLAIQYWQWNVALHGIATKLKAQNCTKMRRLSSSSCWSLTCRSKAPGQPGGVKDNCRTLNIDECQQAYWSGRCWLSTHQSTPIISKRNVSSPIHTISYSYFYALALIHSALCRPSQVLLKRNLSHELSRQLWTQLLIHPWLDRRSDVDVLHAWEKRNSFLRDQEDQEDHELTS